MGVKFAPMDVPMERRLQTIAAAGWICLLMFGEILAVAFTVYLIRTSYFYIGVAYVLIIAKQRNSGCLGQRSWSWVRQWTWWSYLQAYFPIKLVKTVDLSPDNNYLFCVFPHGVLSTGCFVNFATDATNFEGIFPGMKSHMVTLQGHFLVPFFRELAIWLGLCASSPESINFVLNKKNGTGKCAALVVGGAAESLNCHPGLYKVILKRRKGFVKLAMKNGTPLVPVFSFGETELYEQFKNPEGSLVRILQDWFRETTGIAPILPLGRGLLQYSFGIVPQRKTVTTVVGKPIEVARNPDPTEEEIDRVHTEFIKGLEDMFEEGKSKYLPHQKNARLIID
ncbi:2-acylglycerol O-acyltransferase 1-like isoform X2 [Arctopsyche grandis]